MKELVKAGIITKKTGIRSVSYILNDDRMFFPSNYRVLNGLDAEGLIKCEKVLYNGRIKLLYPVKNLKNLNSIPGYVRFGTFSSIAAKVFRIILEVRANGFLNAGNLDLDGDRIYVDPETFKVGLCYLPLAAGYTNEYATEIAFRGTLAEIIQGEQLYTGRKAEEVCAALTKQSVSAEELFKLLSDVAAQDPGRYLENRKQPEIAPPEKPTAELVLLSESSGFPLEFHIDKTEYILGKSTRSADGVIPCSTVSRKHCRITCEDLGYFIEDLDSTNGTTLNGIRLQSTKKYSLADRDELAVSDVKFRVKL